MACASSGAVLGTQREGFRHDRFAEVSALRWRCLTFFAVTVSAPAAEPSPQAVATAQELIKLKGAARSYEQGLISIIEQAEYSFLQNNPMLQNELNASAIQVRKDMQPELDRLVNHVAALYASHFTEKELQDILAFYKSPLGEKLVKVEPEVLTQSIDYTKQWAAKVSNQVVAKMREEMHKRGHDL